MTNNDESMIREKSIDMIENFERILDESINI